MSRPTRRLTATRRREKESAVEIAAEPRATHSTSVPTGREQMQSQGIASSASHYGTLPALDSFISSISSIICGPLATLLVSAWPRHLCRFDSRNVGRRWFYAPRVRVVPKQNGTASSVSFLFNPQATPKRTTDRLKRNSPSVSPLEFLATNGTGGEKTPLVAVGPAENRPTAAAAADDDDPPPVAADEDTVETVDGAVDTELAGGAFRPDGVDDGRPPAALDPPPLPPPPVLEPPALEPAPPPPLPPPPLPGCK